MIQKHIFLLPLFLVTIILVYPSLSTNNINNENDNNNPNVNDFPYSTEEIKTTNFQIRVTACLSLIQSSLQSSEGNKYLIKAISKTKMDREKFYDKYTIALIYQCVNKIKQNQIEYILTPENVENHEYSNETVIDLLKLDYEIKTVELSEEENLLLNELNSQFTQKPKKDGDSFWSGNMKKILFFVIPMIALFLFNNYRNLNRTPEKKKNDPATEELVNAIKARGKKSPNYKETVDDKEKDKEKEKDKVKDKVKKE